MSSKDLTEILDTCLRDIEEGWATVDECLARFPEHADELESMLRVALALRQSTRPSLSEKHLKALEERITTRLEAGVRPPSFDMGIQIEEYTRLPAIPAEGGEGTLWRVILISSNPDHNPLGLDIHSDVIVGRSGEDVTVDLDLTGYDAEALGVSRRHALLRPTRDDLLLLDLMSTNGTTCDGVRLRPGVALKLSDGDTVSFGGLHLKIKLVRQPEQSDM